MVFAVIDVVPHLAAIETHQRSWEFSVTSKKGLFQHNPPEAVGPPKSVFYPNRT
jgi:hypothetical protein